MNKKVLLVTLGFVTLALSAHASLLLTFDANNPASLADTLPNSTMIGGSSGISIVAGSGSNPDRVRLHSQLATDNEAAFSYAVAWSANMQQHSFLTTHNATAFSFNSVGLDGGYSVQMYLGVFSENVNNVQPTGNYGASYGLYFFYSTVNNTLQIIERHNKVNTVLGSVVLNARSFDNLSFITDGITYAASYTLEGETVTFSEGALSTPLSVSTWGSVSQLYLQSVRYSNTAAVYGDLYVGSIGVNPIPEASTYAWMIGLAAVALVSLRLKRRK